MLNKIITFIVIFSVFVILAGCAESGPLNVEYAGYEAPPEDTTVGEELQLEYDRCMKIGRKKNCAQAAYDMVRKVKGLDPKPVPKGVVIILEGDGGHGEADAEQKDADSQDLKNKGK